MIDLPSLAALIATASDGRFIAAVVVAILAGVVRGFSGFGSALIYVPLVSSIYGPHVATVSYAIVDYVCVLPYALSAFPHARWREVLPAYAAALLTVPLGITTQRAVDPAVLRWGMSLFVLTFVVLLARGWRYPFKPSAPAAVGVGALSGFAGGAAQMSGPPAVLYWLGSPDDAALIRANLLVFFILVGLTLLANYAWHGMMTPQPLSLAVLLWPVYIIALAIGARWFRGASDQSYRRIAYTIVTLAAVTSLPLFDKIWH